MAGMYPPGQVDPETLLPRTIIKDVVRPAPRTCGNCDFYKETQKATEYFPSDGQCRIRSVADGSAWPKRRGDDWCGEFKRR